MQLHKSHKAKLELSSRSRALNLRERSALFLADGVKTRHEMLGLLRDDGSMVDKLITDGYLIVLAGGAAAMPANARAPLPSAPSVPEMASVTAPAALASDAPALGADNFEGKRSLATTRMFLFDICERMFVRKMPELAKNFRDQLREARDRESMMVIAREIILHVEEIAGAERADGLSQRIAMLLPPEQ